MATKYEEKQIALRNARMFALDLEEKPESIAEAVRDLIGGDLGHEHARVARAALKHPAPHKAVIELVGMLRYGITRSEAAKALASVRQQDRRGLNATVIPLIDALAAGLPYVAATSKLHRYTSERSYGKASLDLAHARPERGQEHGMKSPGRPGKPIVRHRR